MGVLIKEEELIYDAFVDQVDSYYKDWLTMNIDYLREDFIEAKGLTKEFQDFCKKSFDSINN